MGVLVAWGQEHKWIHRYVMLGGQFVASTKIQSMCSIPHLDVDIQMYRTEVLILVF